MLNSFQMQFFYTTFKPSFISQNKIIDIQNFTNILSHELLPYCLINLSFDNSYEVNIYENQFNKFSTSKMRSNGVLAR